MLFFNWVFTRFPSNLTMKVYARILSRLQQSRSCARLRVTQVHVWMSTRLEQSRSCHETTKVA